MRATDYRSRDEFIQAARRNKLPYEKFRKATAPRVRPELAPKQGFPVDERELYQCVHRKGAVATAECRTCGNNKPVDVYECTVHGLCTIRRKAEDGNLKLCQICPDRKRYYDEVQFAPFKNKFEGKSAWVIGKGLTTFDYADLTKTDDPVFFINDAVFMEKYVVHDHKFFFAQDERQHVWLEKISSLACLPLGGPIAKTKDYRTLQRAGRVMFWRNSGSGDQHLIHLTKDQVEIENRLYRGRKGAGGTIMPMTQFAWFCGIKHLNLVGCDGLPIGYDPRIPNLSQSPAPQIAGLDRFGRFNAEQQWLMAHFGMTATYHGTPQNPEELLMERQYDMQKEEERAKQGGCCGQPT